MSRLQEIGDLDGWRCWLCDGPVDPAMSVNDARGPSIDLRTTKAKAKAKAKGKAKHGDAGGQERLAHRSCNTRKGAVAPEVPWPDHLFVVDPAPIIASVERLERKGGREIMARCPTRADAEEASSWLLDRLSRLQPSLDFSTEIDRGGDGVLLVLRAP